MERRTWALALILLAALLLARVAGPVAAAPSTSGAPVASSTSGAPAFLTTDETDEPLMPEKPPVVRPDVYELKSRLTDLGLYSGTLDEVYDAAASEAVKKFQKSFWLEPNGVVDHATWRALGYGVARPGTTVTGPPPEGFVRLDVDVDELRLTVFIDDVKWKSYAIAGGKWTDLTPVGEWRIVDKGYEKGGAFGSRWMALNVPWGSYGIHGTNRPWSIGSYASAGCIRMFNEDVEELFEIASIGTPVSVHGPRPALNLDREIGRGSVGPEVVMLQERLRAMGFDAGSCDGQFGGLTEASVREVVAVFGVGAGTRVTADIYILLGMRGR